MLFQRLSLLFAGILLLLSVNLAAAQKAGPRSTRPPEIINAGVGGNSSANLLLRLDRDVLSRHPDIVVLLVGTNDMLNPARLVSLQVYRKNLSELVTRIATSGAQLLLLTAPPCYAPYLLSRHDPALFKGEEPNEKIRAANAIIRTIAQERKIPLVDLYPVFAEIGAVGENADSLLRNINNSGAKDGVHPTPAGYQVMARKVAETMRLHDLAAKRRIVCFGDSITFGAHVKGAGTATGETYPAQLALLLAR